MLPADYVDHGKTMANRIAYLVRLYNIPKALVVKSNQTGIHLISTKNSRA